MTTPPTTSQLIKKYELAAKKTLGQNFILDKNITDKIARSANIQPNDYILEIGPGPGGLTQSILGNNPKQLNVIERDERCLNALNEIKTHYTTPLNIIPGDALEINESELFKDKKFKIIANLPYNIGTLLLFKWLKIAPQITSMHLMLQQEVVERITAKPGEKHYGRLAVMVNFLCETKMLFKVNRFVFTPPPKVTSAIVEIIPREKPLADVDFKKLEKIVAAAFNQRRKMLKSSLKGTLQNPEETLTKLGINPELRAEKLTIQDFCKIATSC